MADESLKPLLEEQFSLFAGGASSAKRQIADLISTHAGVARTDVAVSSAKGGTKQLLNRLGQAEVSKAKQLTIFFLDDAQHVQPSVEYIVDAARQRNDARPPAGPVALVAPSGAGLSVVALVASRPSKASELIREIFHPQLSDPRESIKPIVPPGAGLWLLRSSGVSSYQDIDGIRYHFKASLPNGQTIKQGDVIVSTRNASSDASDAGHIFGLGRVGRRIPADGGSHAYVYFDRFQFIDPPLDIKEFGDPRSNVNSIWGVEAEWLIKLMKTVGIESLEELPVPFTALTLEEVQAEVSARDLVFAPGLLERTLTALRSGKHLMFTGPPGTGKTTLALAVAAAASRAGLCGDPLLTTGTADWTSAETVGTYRLTRSEELQFHPGHVVTAITDDRWLVIDELNRADIDKAIGQLFTVLSGQAVVLPFDEDQGEELLPISIVPPGENAPPGTSPRMVSHNWRLLATLNDRDRDLLFDMSEALMRRFAIIEVAPPTSAVWQEILAVSGGTGRSTWDTALQNVLGLPALQQRPLGAAVLLDCVRHLREVAHLHEERDSAPDEAKALQEVLDLYIRPQLRLITGTVALDAAMLAGKEPGDGGALESEDE